MENDARVPIAGASVSADQMPIAWGISTGLNERLESREVVTSFSVDGTLYACAIAPDDGRSGNGFSFVAGGASGRIHFLRLERVDA